MEAAAAPWILVGGSAVGATPGAWQALGVVLVGAGVLLVRGIRVRTDTPGVVLALSISATIAGYTLVVPGVVLVAGT